ncbi:hypothetical protein [Alloscardovia omnicolens]|uniref:hypothetical protein n=1 Tax=Alloscardovia omnicolens TaxID=419015 RepID=UPI003A76B483
MTCAENSTLSSSTPRFSTCVERLAHSRSFAFFIIASLVIITLEITVFNIGSWLSPSGNHAVHYNLATSESVEKKNAAISHSAADKTTVDVQSFGAQLSFPTPASQRVRSIIFTPSQAASTHYATQATIGSQRISLSADRPTFVSLHESTSQAIAQHGKLTVQLVDGPHTRVNIQSVTLNAHKPFHFNILRVVLLLLVAVLLWSIRPRSHLYTIKLNTHSRSQKIAFWGSFAAPVILVSLILLVRSGIFVGTDTWSDSHNYIYSYRHYIYMAQSILDGHAWLDIPVDPQFDALANPYNPLERNAALAQGAQIYWDYAFFNHHWYSYFGMLPSLVLYIPFHLLTGAWPSLTAVNILLLTIALIMLISATIRFIARFFPQASIGSTLLVLVCVFIGTNLVSLIAVANLYVIAFASALCMVTIGLFLWLKVSPEHTQSSNAWHMGIGSVCIALSTSCRPTFIFSAILVLPIFLDLIWRKPWRAIVRATALNLGAACAGLLPALWYNWWRFGSIFDFGAGYQITVADMRHIHASTLSIIQGMSIYLFQPLQITSDAPYLESPFLSTHTWIHRESIIGGFFIFTPLIAFSLLSLWSQHIRARLSNHFAWMYPGLGCVTGLFLCCVVTLGGGIVWRYFVDFSWAFVFAGIPPLLAALDIAENQRTNWRWKLLSWVIALLSLYQIMLLVMSIFVPNRLSPLTEYAPSLYATFVDALTFGG